MSRQARAPRANVYARGTRAPLSKEFSMRSILFVTFAGLMVLALSSCKTSGTAESGPAAADASTYQCPMCKETMAWSYSSKTFGQDKVMTHNCPACKKTWMSGMSAGNTCLECAKAEHMCPMCMKAGSK